MEENKPTKNQPIETPGSEQTPPVHQEPKNKPRVLIAEILAVTIFIGVIVFIAFPMFKAQPSKPITQISPTPANPTPIQVNTSDWKTYANTPVGFSVKYPSTFSDPVIPGADFETKANGKEEGGDIIFAEKTQHIQFILSIGPYPKTLEDLSKEYIKSVTYKGAPGSLPVSVALFKEISIDHVPASWYISNVGSETTANTVLFVHNNRSFTFRTNLVENSPEDVRLMEQILSTFRFTDQTIDTSSWKKYTSPQFGFEIKYPTGWVIKPYIQDDKDNTGVNSLIDLSPQNYNGVIINITSFDNPNNLSLQKWDELRKQKPGVDFKLFDSSDEQLQTGNGITVFYRKNGFCEPLSCEMYTIQTSGKIYRISSFGEKIVDQKQIFQQILSTFKFTK